MPEGTETQESQLPMTVEESLRLSVFLSKDKDVKDPVKNTLKKGMRVLAESKKYDEIAKLMRFAEELGEKFLSTLGEQRFKTKDPFKLLQLLQTERPDWKEILKRFNKAKSYKIKPHIGDEPAMIIFKYADGKVEEYPLELSYQQRLALGNAITDPLRRRAQAKGSGDDKPRRSSDGDKDMEEMLAAIEKRFKKKSEDRDEAESKAQDEKALKQQLQRMAEIKARCSTLQTPSDVSDYILNNSQYLSEDLAKELSEPIAQIACLLAGMDITGQGIHFGDSDAESAYGKAHHKIVDILEKYYQGFKENGIEAVTSPEKRKDLLRILSQLVPDL